MKKITILILLFAKFAQADVSFDPIKSELSTMPCEDGQNSAAIFGPGGYCHSKYETYKTAYDVWEHVLGTTDLAVIAAAYLDRNQKWDAYHKCTSDFQNSNDYHAKMTEMCTGTPGGNPDPSAYPPTFSGTYNPGHVAVANTQALMGDAAMAGSKNLAYGDDSETKNSEVMGKGDLNDPKKRADLAKGRGRGHEKQMSKTGVHKDTSKATAASAPGYNPTGSVGKKNLGESEEEREKKLEVAYSDAARAESAGSGAKKFGGADYGSASDGVKAVKLPGEAEGNGGPGGVSEFDDEYFLKAGNLSLFERVHPVFTSFGVQAEMDMATAEFKKASK